MPIETADDLFLNELKDIYSAEKQAIRAYPRMAKKITSEELRDAVEQHLEQTQGQVERLDQIFEILEKKSGGKTCEAMKGLIDEATELAGEIEQGPVLDAAIIGALQKMEHYEIASYGTVIAFAEAMGQNEIQQLLQQTLDEEKETDEKLTGVSRNVNEEAIGGDEEGDESDEDEEDEDDSENEDDEEEEEKPAARKTPAKKSAAKGGKK
jgi:ferritin-like metal-binding protein YciE